MRLTELLAPSLPGSRLFQEFLLLHLRDKILWSGLGLRGRPWPGLQQEVEASLGFASGAGHTYGTSAAAAAGAATLDGLEVSAVPSDLGKPPDNRGR